MGRQNFIQNDILHQLLIGRPLLIRLPRPVANIQRWLWACLKRLAYRTYWSLNAKLALFTYVWQESTKRVPIMYSKKVTVF